MKLNNPFNRQVKKSKKVPPLANQKETSSHDDLTLDHNMVAGEGSVKAGKKRKLALERELRQSKTKQKMLELMFKKATTKAETNSLPPVQSSQNAYYLLAKSDGYDFERDILGFGSNFTTQEKVGKQYRDLRNMMEEALSKQTSFKDSSPEDFLTMTKATLNHVRFEHIGKIFKAECFKNCVPKNVSTTWTAAVLNQELTSLEELESLYEECFVEKLSLTQLFRSAFPVQKTIKTIGSDYDTEMRNLIPRIVKALNNVSPKEQEAALYVALLDENHRMRANQDKKKVWSSINETAGYLKNFQPETKKEPEIPIATVGEFNGMQPTHQHISKPRPSGEDLKKYWRERNITAVAKALRMDKDEVKKLYGEEIQKRSDRRVCALCEQQNHRAHYCRARRYTLSSSKEEASTDTKQ